MHRLAAIVALVASACSFAPSYERPTAPISNQWNAAAEGTDGSTLGWRQVFGDARLQAVVELALENNRDLRVAALNVELVRAQYRIERSTLFPSLAAGGGAEFRGAQDTDVTRQYSVGLSLSYEIDLFGRLRNLRASALEEYLASEQAHRAARIALVAEVANQYLTLRAFEEQYVLAEQTLGLVRESAEVTRRLLEGGQRSELDLRTAEAQIATAQAELARVVRLRAQAHNALVLLVGVPALPASLPPPAPLETTAVVPVGAGVPSQVLLRRPDVLAAEHELRAANANIGVARAAFLPSISLTGFGGFASTALSSLFSGGSALWTAGAQLAAPLFQGGRLRAELDVSKVRKQIEVAQYEQSIQTAFREVADALAARAALEDQLKALVARVEAEQKRFEISEQRYRAGIENYLVVISAQRDLFIAQLALIETRLARLQNLVGLYRALGGGWR